MKTSERNATQDLRTGVRIPVPGSRGVTLVELLVVLAILMLLLGVMASALGAFAHTSRVEAAAQTLCEFYRTARYKAMKQSVEVLPALLRDKQGRITGVHAEKALRFNGSLTEGEAAPVIYPPAAMGGLSSPWSFTRRAAAAGLAEGGFAFVIGAATLDLNNLTQPQAYPELVYLKATPPASKSFANDAAQYRFEILARGVHNTRIGTFDSTTIGYRGADLYVVSSATNTNANVAPANAADYALSGVNLPDHVSVDMAPDGGIPGPAGAQCATVTAQAAIFRERSALATGGGIYEPARYMPVWLPVFMPDGHVSNGPGGPGLGGLEARTSAYRDMTLRVMDTVTREARYITIRCSDGQVFVSTKLPPAYGMAGDGIPGLNDIPEYDPTSSTTTTTSTSASSSNSTTTSTSSSQTTASTTSASTSSASSTSSTTASSTSSSTTSTSASSTTSTATSGATSSATSSTTSTSNSTSSTTASSTSNSTSSTSASSTSTSASSSTSSTSGAPPGGGGTNSSSGGTSSGNGGDWPYTPPTAP